MTQKQIDNFNRSVEMLYWSRYRGATLLEIAVRYKLTTQRVAKILIRAQLTKKVIYAAEKYYHNQLLQGYWDLKES